MYSTLFSNGLRLEKMQLHWKRYTLKLGQILLQLKAVTYITPEPRVQLVEQEPRLFSSPVVDEVIATVDEDVVEAGVDPGFLQEKLDDWNKEAQDIDVYVEVISYISLIWKRPISFLLNVKILPSRKPNVNLSSPASSRIWYNR